MAQTKRLALSDVRKINEVGDLSNLVQQVELAAAFEERFELDGDVEVVLDGVLPTHCDENDVVDARSHRLFDPVLDDGFVDERQHLFGLRFGGGQKPGPEAGRRENSLAHRCHACPLESRPLPGGWGGL